MIDATFARAVMQLTTRMGLYLFVYLYALIVCMMTRAAKTLYLRHSTSF